MARTALALALGAALAVCLSGKDKPAKPEAPQAKLVASGAAGDDKIHIAAKAMLDRESIKQAIGEDIGAGYIVVEVTVEPHGDAETKPVLDLDDFLLRSDKDGQHSRPLSPSQVAGSATLMVKSVGGTQGNVGQQQNRVPYGYPGGYPGRYPSGGPPQTIPAPGQSGGGSATADTSSAEADIREDAKAKASPLLLALKSHVLAEGEFDKPVTGLLYFQIEGKVKPKQLELVYRKAPPRVSVRFVEPGKK